MEKQRKMHFIKQLLDTDETRLFGRYQYLFSTEKGTISVIFHRLYGQFEIYCLKGNLFMDTERFYDMEDAYKKIEYYRIS